LVIFTINAPAPRAQTLSAADTQATRSALAAAQIGDLGRAYAEAATTTDPLPLKMLRWMDCARPGAAGRFPEIAEFIEKNPDWPGQKALRKHAEEALAGESDAVAAEWLKRFPPLSTAGKIREAEILLNSGDLAGGPEALRATWIGGDFGPLDQKNFIARYSASIRSDDHAKRVDRLLWDGQTEAAHRMLPLVPSDSRALAEARLALAAQSANADALVARLPAQLRSDPGLIFEQLRSRRKKDMTDAAMQILLAQPGDLVRPAAWWNERQAIARRVLASGNAELAYRIVAAWFDRRKRLCRSPVPIGLYRAPLHEAAGARVRPFLADSDARRHPLCEGAGRVLGRPRCRGAGKGRAGRKVVYRRGRSHGHLLWAARRARIGP
jgi:soluble lytic murein transglycosylase